MEELSQTELIGVVAIIRDKEEYQKYIYEKNLIRELHKIIHNERSEDNVYHGEWNKETRNYVIHQILWRIIPKEERVQYTKDHPLLKKIKELEDENESINKVDNSIHFRYTSMVMEICDLKRKISEYETLEIKNYIQQINEHIHTIDHYQTNFVNPLLKLGWINGPLIIPRGFDPNISEESRQRAINECLVYDHGLIYNLPHKKIVMQLSNKYKDEQKMNKKLLISSFILVISTHAITLLIFWETLFFKPDIIWLDPLMIKTQDAITHVEVLSLSLIFLISFNDL